MDISTYVDSLAARGRYHFTTAEAIAALDSSPIAARAAIRRLREKARVAMPFRGFHLIVPPEYRALGCLPADQFRAAAHASPRASLLRGPALRCEPARGRPPGTHGLSDRCGRQPSRDPLWPGAGRVRGTSATSPRSRRCRRTRCAASCASRRRKRPRSISSGIRVTRADCPT